MHGEGECHKQSEQRKQEKQRHQTETDRDRQRQTETDRDRHRQTETHMDTWGPSKAPWASVSIIAGPIRAPLSSLMGMWHWLIDAAWHDLTLRHNRRHVWSH